MVHAVPTRTTSTGARTGGTGTGRGTGRDTSGRRMPDVFGARTHLLAKWAMPLAIGLVYGYWAASVRRHGGPVTGWNLLFGFMTVLAFALLWYVVRAVADRLPREGHAVLWGRSRAAPWASSTRAAAWPCSPASWCPCCSRRR